MFYERANTFTLVELTRNLSIPRLKPWTKVTYTCHTPTAMFHCFSLQMIYEFLQSEEEPENDGEHRFTGVGIWKRSNFFAAAAAAAANSNNTKSIRQILSIFDEFPTFLTVLLAPIDFYRGKHYIIHSFLW